MFIKLHSREAKEKFLNIYVITITTLIFVYIIGYAILQEYGIEYCKKYFENRYVQSLINEAQQGDPEAQYQLAALYFEGEIIQENREEAVKWLQKSAEQGNAYAQWSLGKCYYYGVEVQIDEEKAFELAKKANEKVTFLGDYYLKMKMERDMERMVELCGPEAHYELGQKYMNGTFCHRKNEKKAIKWFQKAAEAGHRESKEILERMNAQKEEEDLLKTSDAKEYEE